MTHSARVSHLRPLTRPRCAHEFFSGDGSEAFHIAFTLAH